MDAPLDELYFSWLYEQVASVEIADPSRTYWEMLKRLYTKEFVWFVPNDDNRAEDGRLLRQEFMDVGGYASVDGDWLRLGCSVLELLIALSRRLAFEAEGEPRHWFWELVENLGLDQYNDHRRVTTRIDDILDDFIWRTYRSNGRGGLFPLKRPAEDQREVEIWYQMCEYILEHAA